MGLNKVEQNPVLLMNSFIAFLTLAWYVLR